MIIKCPICYSRKQKEIWYGKIRDGIKNYKTIYSKKKIKIFFCNNCGVRYKYPLTKDLLNNQLFRKKYDGEASIKKYYSFNKTRELKKFHKIFKLINFKNKSILESNCGGGEVLNYLKKNTKNVSGIDSLYLKNHLNKKKIMFFENINEIKKKKVKFDIIISLGEIEHRYDPKTFIKKFLNILKPGGLLILRAPNYNNIYRLGLGKIFLRDDFRTSHNFYFDEKSLDYIFSKLGLKILIKKGLQEYSINNFISYLKLKKRPKNLTKNIVNQADNKKFELNLENSLYSTSLMYVLKNV